jgi:2,4-dienoyl-CoA reductase-like NADH-dependent reductase (Old Yellow Enzyme family)/thioredoxin reductase
MPYEKLLSPMNIGRIMIKNRVVMPAMMIGHGQFDGTPTQQMMDYYEARAKGGVGLIITEITRVNDMEGAGAFAQLAASQDYHIKPLNELVKRVHNYDCKIFVQLHHPGRQSIPLTVGTLPIAIGLERISPRCRDIFYKMTPLARKMQDRGIVLRVAAPSKTKPCKFAKGRNRALRKKEVKKIIRQFAEAAKRVQVAGADGVELHAAHGYLIQEFLSPYTNKRTDEYGGSFDNRMRFLLEIIGEIKETCGDDFPIIIRLTVDECYAMIGEEDKGYTLEEGVKIAKRLEEAGVAAINVSSGSYETMNYWLEPASFALGWRKYMSEAVKKEVSIPVIAANLIRSPKQAEEQLEAGIQDFVALGRPHLADPCWTHKVQTGCETDIKRCICCLWCFESMEHNAYLGLAGTCAVNPRMGAEKKYEQMNKNGEGRQVVIVGAGPAGLTAAEILGERGFKPIVLEKEEYAGGQTYLGSLPPHKQRIYWCIEDLLVAAKRQGADILFNTRADAAIINSFNPYAVIIATGAHAVKPSIIKGIEQSNVCTITDILKEKVTLTNKTVAVIGSGMSGLETAEKLAVEGNNIIIVEMSDTLAPNTHRQHVDDILPRLKQYNTEFLLGHRLEEIRDNYIVVKELNSKNTKDIKIDNVVISLGVESENQLYKELLGGFDQLYVIGDAKKCGRIAQAIHSAAHIALNL